LTVSFILEEFSTALLFVLELSSKPAVVVIIMLCWVCAKSGAILVIYSYKGHCCACTFHWC